LPLRLHHVTYFLALCHERSFTRAARRCGVAQPSLTQAIKRLEQELGKPLFVRLRLGAELTEFGLRLEPHFSSIAQSIAQIERACLHKAELRSSKLFDRSIRKTVKQCGIG